MSRDPSRCLWQHDLRSPARYTRALFSFTRRSRSPSAKRPSPFIARSRARAATETLRCEVTCMPRRSILRDGPAGSGCSDRLPCSRILELEALPASARTSAPRPPIAHPVASDRHGHPACPTCATLIFIRSPPGTPGEPGPAPISAPSRPRPRRRGTLESLRPSRCVTQAPARLRFAGPACA